MNGFPLWWWRDRDGEGNGAVLCLGSVLIFVDFIYGWCGVVLENGYIWAFM